MKQPRAFTLIEIMAAVSILSIVLLTAGPTFRKSTVSTKGAALSLAAALTEARQQAITQQVPVALVIPSGNGSLGQADSYYIASGEQPRITQVKWLGAEQPDLRVMVCHWPLDTAKLQDPTLTTTITPPPEATFESDLDVNLWKLTQPKDFAFIFTPRGKLVTNGLPHFDGAYHILVSGGGNSTPAVAPGTFGLSAAARPTLFTPSEVGSPYTVTIDLAGPVAVTPGVVGAFDGASYIREQAQVGAAPAPAIADPKPTIAPVVTSVKLLPDPAKLKLPTGVNMILSPKRHMTLTVRARSPQRVPLTCQWTADRGGLSSAESVRMTYLPATSEWEGVWQWRAPEEAVTGEKIRFRGKVMDGQGNEAPAALSSTVTAPVVQLGDDDGQIAFVSNRDAYKQDIYSMHPDGSGLKKLSDIPGSLANISWSPDGDRILVEQSVGSNYEILLMNADGSGVTNLTNTPGYEFRPKWSPDGTQIAFTRPIGSNGEVWVMNADGSDQRNLTNHFAGDSFLSWSPDGQRIAFSSYRDGNNEIYSVKLDGSELRNLTNHPSKDIGYEGAAWSPDGKEIVFHSDRDGGRGYTGDYTEIYVMDADGSNLRNLTNRPGRDEMPAWSPDGNRIAYWSDIASDAEVFVMNKDGSGKTNLSNYANGTDVWPVWVKNDRLIFRASRPNNYAIQIANVDGSGLQDLTKDPVWSHYYATFR